MVIFSMHKNGALLVKAVGMCVVRNGWGLTFVVCCVRDDYVQSLGSKIWSVVNMIWWVFLCFELLTTHLNMF